MMNKPPQIGNDERGIFQKFRSSRILNLNDHRKVVKKKSSLGLPINTKNNDERLSKKRKHSDFVAEIQEIQMEKLEERPKVIRSKPEEVKEQEVTKNQYLTEYKIDCPKDFHYENYFSSKRDELQDILLNDPIMSVDELFDLESLKLVFGTSAIKKDGEDIEKNGQEVAPRRKKYYDFSETNVKVDDILSHSPIVRTLLEEEDDMDDDFQPDKRSKRHYIAESTHEFPISTIKDHFNNQEEFPKRNLNFKKEPNYFDPGHHNPQIYMDNNNLRKNIIDKYTKYYEDKPRGIIAGSPREHSYRDEYKAAQLIKKDNLYAEEEYDDLYKLRFQNQHKHDGFYPVKDFYYIEKPKEPDVYRFPQRERVDTNEDYFRVYNYSEAPNYQTFKIDNNDGSRGSMQAYPLKLRDPNIMNYPNNEHLSSTDEAFKAYQQKNHRSNSLMQDQNKQKYQQYCKEQPYFGRRVVGEPIETIVYQNEGIENKSFRVPQVGPNYIRHQNQNAKVYPFMS